MSRQVHCLLVADLATQQDTNSPPYESLLVPEGGCFAFRFQLKVTERCCLKLTLTKLNTSRLKKFNPYFAYVYAGHQKNEYNDY
jgi:hypothetical protein